MGSLCSCNSPGKERDMVYLTCNQREALETLLGATAPVSVGKVAGSLMRLGLVVRVTTKPITHRLTEKGLKLAQACPKS